MDKRERDRPDCVRISGRWWQICALLSLFLDERFLSFPPFCGTFAFHLFGCVCFRQVRPFASQSAQEREREREMEPLRETERTHIPQYEIRQHCRCDTAIYRCGLRKDGLES